MNPSSVNISGILNGLSKALTVANQAIPLYKQVSPMIGKAKNMVSIMKEINKSNPKQPIKNTNNTKIIKKEPVYNNPVFFQ